MKKIINNPYECGYCNIEENYRDTVCKHPENIDGKCDNPETFPEKCPLINYECLTNFSERDWTEDFSHENGNYLNKCLKCNKLFYGYKRRCICKLCKNKIEDVYAEDCKFFDCAQGRDICINENIGGNRCIGVCKYFEKLKLK